MLQIGVLNLVELLKVSQWNGNSDLWSLSSLPNT